MKKIHLLFLLLVSAGLYAQEDAWVYFNAKPDPQPYFDNPNTILSQRAIDRRILQNIPLDLKDIPIEQSYIDQINELGTVNVMAKSKWLNAIHVRGTVAQINALADLAFVDHVYFANTSLNTTGKKTRNRHPNPLGKTLETAANFPYGGSGNQIQMLNGHLLHQQNFTGSGKIIAVLDAGFPTVDVTLPFKRLRDNNQILGGYNYVDRNDDFYSRNQHGTMVLSTMGGYVAGELVGTAPDASYYLFITEASESENPVEESLWVEAAETADSLGVDVINTSLGYFGYDNPGYSYEYDDMNGTTSFVARGADIAFTRGMIVVASAGNSGDSDNPNIGTPADAANVLTIGAVDANGQYVPFSSIGPTSDGRIKPDVDAKGLAATVANTAGNVVTGSGTSFSSPIMAGMVATFWQAFPDLTNVQVVQLIKESASLFDTPTDEMGYGIPDFQYALTLAMLANEDFSKDKFIVYPNPARDWLFVSIPETAAEAEMVFYNDLGQTVAKKKINAVGHSVDISDLANGIYLYSITAGSKTQSGKLIKG